MRTRDEVSADKLRGGFYTSASLVDFCVRRALELTDAGAGLRVLEPTAGDGAFVRGLARAARRGEASVSSLVAVELQGEEAERTSAALAESGLPGRVVCDDFLAWALGSADERFDLVVGNPPFVRFQFLDAALKERARRVAASSGVELRGVSNLWIPIAMGAIGKLRPHGGFALVLPAEVMQGVAAGAFRAWLLESCDEVRADVFAPGSFPGVLQEVLVLSGRVGVPSPVAHLRVAEHLDDAERPLTDHLVTPSTDGWTRYLLDRLTLDAFDIACAEAAVVPLGSLARFEVSTVTGANDFFTVTDAVVEERDLRTWARPLLARIRHAPGLRYTAEDRVRAQQAGERTWLLDFAAETPEPPPGSGAARYLAAGETQGLAGRYKCRIRTPWYRVPVIEPGELLLSKRSHRQPKVVVNAVGAVTTDTIYRGRLVDGAPVPAAAVAAAFQNSLTLMSAEIEGRSFGGGVLELVPSEVARIALPVAGSAAGALDRLDALSRGESGEQLTAETDDLVLRHDLGLDADVVEAIARGRRLLQQRRLDRNAVRRTPVAVVEPSVDDEAERAVVEGGQLELVPREVALT